jgi:hypothetical protein
VRITRLPVMGCGLGPRKAVSHRARGLPWRTMLAMTIQWYPKRTHLKAWFPTSASRILADTQRTHPLARSHPDFVAVREEVRAAARRAPVTMWKPARGWVHHLFETCPALAKAATPVAVTVAALNAEPICAGCAGRPLDLPHLRPVAALEAVESCIALADRIAASPNWAAARRRQLLRRHLEELGAKVGGGPLHDWLVAYDESLAQSVTDTPGSWWSTRQAALRVVAATGRPPAEGIGWSDAPHVGVHPELGRAVRRAGVSAGWLGWHGEALACGASIDEAGMVGRDAGVLDALGPALAAVNCMAEARIVLLGAQYYRTLLTEAVVGDCGVLHTAPTSTLGHRGVDVVVAANDNLAYLRAAADIDVWDIGPAADFPVVIADPATTTTDLIEFLAAHGISLTEAFDRRAAGIRCRSWDRAAHLDEVAGRWADLVDRVRI